MHLGADICSLASAHTFTRGVPKRMEKATCGPPVSANAQGSPEIVSACEVSLLISTS